jgi:uncharacterized membrane protein
MPSVQRTVVIARPIEDVFAFFTDLNNDPKWRSHVKEIRTDGPLAVGMRVHHVVVGPGGRGIPADFEVTSLEPNSRFSFQVVQGPARPAGDFRFQSTADGATEVSFTLSAEFRGLKKLFITKPVQKAMDGEAASLDRAKELLETDG